MIAVKTYAVCPEDIKPFGIPTVVPWIIQYCEQHEIDNLKKQGFSIFTEEEYNNYNDLISEELNTWLLQASYLQGLSSVNQNILTPAKMFGQKLLDEFASENVLMGITQDGKTGEVLTKLKSVMDATATGSLYEVIYRVKAIPATDYDTKYITSQRLIKILNKIEIYLGLPLTTNL